MDMGYGTADDPPPEQGDTTMFGAIEVRDGWNDAARPAGTGLLRACAVLGLALGLSACESSSRLGSLLPDNGYRTAPRPQAAPEPLVAAPSGDVDTSSLPPPPGAAAPGTDPGLRGSTLGPAPGSFGTQPGVGTAPGDPQYPGGQTSPQGTNPNLPNPNAPRTPQVATAPAPAAAPSRTALIGNWSVSESSGGRCRITLSSAPKLDLYGAGTSGCQSKELQRVNAWELAGSEVILYEPGGGVVARLRQSGGQTYNGAVAKSGAPVSLSK